MSSDKNGPAELKLLRDKIREYEQFREQLEREIDAASRFYTELSEDRKLFERYVHRRAEEYAEITDSVRNIGLVLKSWAESYPAAISISPSRRRSIPFQVLAY
jgi:chromosome segregation ATPase